MCRAFFLSEVLVFHYSVNICGSDVQICMKQFDVL